MLGKTLVFGRAAQSWLNPGKRHGFFLILKSFRSFLCEVQDCSQHDQVGEEETGLRNWNQLEWQHPMCSGRPQMQDWYRRLDRSDVEGSGGNTVDSLLWHGKSCRPFWGIHSNVVQGGNSAWWTRDEGRKTKVQYLGQKGKHLPKPWGIK